MNSLHQPVQKFQVPLRSLFCAIFLLSFTLSLVACNTPSTNGKIQLKLWYWNRSIDDQLLKQVSQVFPNIELQPEKISDYDNKVRTSMAGHHGVPDILGINSNISTYFPDEDQFIDLHTLGVDAVKSEYLDWKWNLGITPDNKMIGFPMDTGPTALFYREDIFAKAGLPTDPQAVSNQIQTWDDYLQAAAKLKDATQGKSAMIDSLSTIYTQELAQSPKIYFTKSGQYIGDQQHIKQLWDEAAKAAKMGVTGKVAMWSTGWNQGVSNGYISSFVGAVWMKQVLQDAAPDTSGKWRIARAPGSAGNSGGSFLAISKYCQHPKEAFEVIKWLQSPQNQLQSYKTLQLFPSVPSILSSPDMHHKEAFYGGQDATDIFASAAKDVPLSYSGPDDGIVGTAISDQLNLVEFQNKNPAQAWNDAQQETQRQLLR